MWNWTTKKLSGNCGFNEKENCIVCGKWLSWIDLMNPGRQPTHREWQEQIKINNERHVKQWELRYNKLSLLKISKMVKMVK